MARLRLAAVILLATVASFWWSDAAHGSHDDFRFKWPYRPGVADGTTTLPGQGGHADAWDFDIGLNDIGDEVVSSAGFPLLP